MDITTHGPTLALHGDFDVRSTFEVRTAIYERLEAHDQDVIVDMSDVETIDVVARYVENAAAHNLHQRRWASMAHYSS